MKTYKATLSILIALSFSLAFPRFILSSPSHAQTPTILYVKPAASGDCLSWVSACSLPSALSRSISADQIWVAAGTYYPTASTDRAVSFSLKNGVSVYGGFPAAGGPWDSRDPLANPTVLSGDIGVLGDISDNSYHVVKALQLDNSTLLDSFTITAGNANGPSPDEKGGGMFAFQSTLTLSNLVFTGNTAANTGGGLANNRSSPSLSHIVFSDNFSGVAGGGMSNYLSSPVLSQVDFIANTSAINSGGMHNEDSHPVLQNCEFSGNSAQDLGGGMYNESSDPILENVNFSNNTTGHLGGGICNSLSSPSLMNVTFTANSAESGGGVSNFRGAPRFENVTFTQNSASKYGAGLLNEDSAPVLMNVPFSDNTAVRRGAGIHNYLGSLQMDHSVFQNNTAGISGGGIYSYESSLQVSDLTFTGNTAQTLGAGMANYYLFDSTFTSLTFSGNTAGDYGGGMYNDYSSPTISQVVFDQNSADHGAGLYNYSSAPSLTNALFTNNIASIGAGVYNYGSSLALTNATFSSNTAQTRGGALANVAGSSSTLLNTTITLNSSPLGAGFYNEGSSPLLTNAIIWGNTQGNLVGTGITATYSIIQGGYPGEGNFSADPLLGPLQDNGGFTLTHALLNGSPAIDAGSPTICPPTDQRGFYRPIDGNADGFAICDIGAFEFASSLPNFLYLPIILK